jgi:AraC-like DNA-binding protein
VARGYNGDVPVPREQGGRRQIAVRDLLPGVVVARFTGDGPLVRAVPDRYSTAFHLAGHSQWTSGRARWSSGPGTISVKVPGEVYAERARDGRAEFQVVMFDAALVDDARAALDRPAVAPRDPAVDGRDPRARPLAELHRQLLDDDDASPALEHAVCAALTAFVDIACAPRGSGLGSSTLSVAVARARAMLDERFTETIALDELAAHARLDKFHLCRAFRDQVGLPPHAYVTHRRVSRAQDLLARGIPQAEVAASVGLYDQSQLHRHFKRILGVTPGAFARAAR